MKMAGLKNRFDKAKKRVLDKEVTLKKCYLCLDVILLPM